MGGEVHLALTATSSSTLQYLAEELVRRAERLEAHGSRSKVSAACADAAALLQQCAGLPDDHGSKPLDAVSAIDRISTAATHARAVHDKHGASHGASPGAVALPLDSTSVMDLFGGTDHMWFLQLFAQRQLPQEEGGVELVRRSRPRAEPLAALLPPALQPQEWGATAPAAWPRVPMSQAPVSTVAQPWPTVTPSVKSERKGTAPARIPGLAAEASLAGPSALAAGGHMRAASGGSAADGPFHVQGRSLSDNGDLYADFAAAEPAPRASLASKRRSSVRSRASSDATVPPRPAVSQPAATPTPVAPVAAPQRPPEAPPKPAEPTAAAAPKPAASKRVPTGMMPAGGRPSGTRLPAGLLPASMPPRPAPGATRVTGPTQGRGGPPVRPAAPALGGLPPPSSSLPQPDLPPPPPGARQVYSRVPAAVPLAPPRDKAPPPTEETRQQCTATTATRAAEAAPVAPNEQQLASLLRDPASLQRLLAADNAAARFLRARLQNKLPKPPGT